MNTHVSDFLGCPNMHESEEDSLGCDKCQDRRRRKKRYAEQVAVFGWSGTTLRGRPYPVVNGFGPGWAPPRALGHNHNPRLGQAVCPVSAPKLDPTLNCQKDARGNTVCSDGMHYPPGCPHTPPEQYFSPGIAPDEVHGGIIEAKIPAPRAAGTAGGAGVPSAPSAPGAAPAAAGGTSPILPIAAIGGVGILAAVLLLR